MKSQGWTWVGSDLGLELELLVSSTTLPTHLSLQWEGRFPEGEGGERLGRMLGVLHPSPRPP